MLDLTGDASHPSPMTELQPARGDDEAYLAKCRVAALCTACGVSMRADGRPHRLRAADGKSVTDGLRRLAMGEAAPAETVAWVGACTKSGRCVAACPERSAGLDAMLLVRIAKGRALNATHQLPAKQDPTMFPRIKIFARLQLSDEELAKWM
jgi:ferredoxin